MECPTCFQKITVPQAPSTEGEQKFILTGTKKGDRPVPTLPEGEVAPVEKKTNRVAIVLVLICLLAALAGIAAYVIHANKSKPSEDANTTDNATAPTNKVVEKPKVVAPPANDANWMLDLSAETNLPDATAAGRIHGEDFITERAILQNGTLTLREGKSGQVTLGVQINFGGAQPESLAGQSLNIQTNAPMAARVTMVWEDGSSTAKSNLEGGYAMRLNFGAVNGNRIAGKIYFCAPDDEKSYIMGSFNAEIRKPKPAKPK